MRRALLRIIAAAVLAGLLLPAGAAAARRPANYGTLKLGGFFPMSDDIDIFDAGFDGEIVLGHVVAPGFAFEGGVGYFSTDGRPDLGLGAVDEKITAIPLTLAFKGTYPVGTFEPYAFAGIGVYFLDDEIGGRSDRDTQPGFFLGAGANVDVNPSLFVGIEGKYLFLRTTAFESERRLDGIVLTANAGIRF